MIGNGLCKGDKVCIYCNTPFHWPGETRACKINIREENSISFEEEIRFGLGDLVEYILRKVFYYTPKTHKKIKVWLGFNPTCKCRSRKYKLNLWGWRWVDWFTSLKAKLWA